MKLICLTFLSFVLLMSFIPPPESDSKKSKRAEKYFTSYAYVKAKNLYEKLAKDTSNHEASIKLAECYYNLNDWPNSERTLRRVVQFANIDPKYFLLYAHALKSIGKIQESDAWMQKFHDSQQADSRGLHYAARENHWKTIVAKESRYKIGPVRFNSAEADFGLVIYKNELIFISARKSNATPINSIYSWNERPFLNVFSVDISKENATPKEKQYLHQVNTQLHDGPIAFDSGFHTMYATQNNFSKNKKLSAAGINQLQLVRYKLLDGTWKAGEALPFNNPEYSVGHACLNTANDKLYFVSDQPGGFGGTDVYSAAVNSDGTYGTVTNLGKNINTEGNEMFPFIDKNEVLFFASDGHPGLGRLDIFYVALDKNGYGKVKNAGISVNSPADDFGITFKNATEGYFASNRSGGAGDDDIYAFTLSKPVNMQFFISGNVHDKHDHAPLKAAKLVLYNGENVAVDSTVSDAIGNYSFRINEGTAYTIHATSPDHLDGQQKVESKLISEDNPEARVNVDLEKNAGYRLLVFVKDLKTGLPIADAHLRIINNKTHAKEDLFSGVDGIGTKVIKEKPNTLASYEIHIEKEGFIKTTMNFEKQLSQHKEFVLHASLSKPEVGMDIAKIVEIKPIYFDVNKSFIRKDAAIELDKIVAVMNDYPLMQIELGAHTDSRGNDAANLLLSKQRARSSADYIVSKGINAERINSKGFGETILINKCGNGIKCSDTDHQLNRRTEFIIKKL